MFKFIVVLIFLSINVMALTADEIRIIRQIPRNDELFIQSLKQNYLESNELDNMPDAINYAEEYARYIEKYFGKESRLYGNVISDLTIFYSKNGDEVNMLKYYNISLPLLQKYHSKRVGRLYQAVGSFYIEEDTNKAKLYFDKAEKEDKRQGLPLNCSLIQNRGYLYKSKSEYTLALLSYEEGLALCLKTFGINSKESLKSYNTLLEYYNEFNFSKKAKELIDKIKNNIELLPESRLKSSLYNKIGAYYYSINQDKKALEYYNKALSYLHKFLEDNNHYRIGTIYTNIASVLSKSEKQKDISQAEEYYKKALKIYYINSNNTDNTQTASVYSLLSNLFLKNNNLQEAFNSLKKSVQFYEKSNEKSLSAMNDYNMMAYFYDLIPQYHDGCNLKNTKPSFSL